MGRPVVGGVKLREVVAALLLLGVGGCATAPSRPASPPFVQRVAADYDKVWVAVEVAARRLAPRILVADAVRGLLETDRIDAPGLRVWLPSLVGETRGPAAAGRYRLRVETSRLEGGETEVRVRADYEYWNQVFRIWQPALGDGSIERRFLATVLEILKVPPLVGEANPAGRGPVSVKADFFLGAAREEGCQGEGEGPPRA